MFISLHNHTYASNIRFLDCINRPEDMVKRAIELGYGGIAFTDHESLSAAVSIIKIRDNIKETNPDFKIIFGNEIYLIDETEIGNTFNYYHFILLAKDEIGWQQLKELSSRAWNRAYMDRGIMRPVTTYQDLEEIVKPNQGHIVGSSACLGGYLDKAVLERNNEKINWFVPWGISVFGKDNFLLEMQVSDSDEQISCNRFVFQMAKYFSLKYIITTDSHYLAKEDAPIHAAFLNSKRTTERETEKFYKYTYMMSEDEIHKVLSIGGLTSEQIDQGLNNTAEITKDFVDFDFRHSTIIPATKLPEFTLSHIFKDYYDKYPLLKHYAYSKFEQDRFLFYQIEEGFKIKGGEITDEKLERINTELDVVLFISKRLKQDVSAYLNLCNNINNLAWQVSLVGAGRGSACGFYTNYLIGITQVDPLKYGLPYWRFLNKERVEMPDIDSDFQPEKTAEIIDILRSFYGNDNVLNCATFKTESLKSATLTAMRGLGYNNDDAQAMAAMVPSHRGKTYTLAQCENGDEEQGFEPVPHFINKLNEYPNLYETVKKIEGLPTNASIHASALYIFNTGYLDHNSLMRAPNKTPITAFSMHDSDDMGALKMDVLRTDAQSKMAKCLDLLIKDGQIKWQGSLRATYDKYLHPDVLDYTSLDMWNKAASGEIANLFQFETQVGSVCIKKAHPTNVTQLAEINSIMRLQVEGDEQPIDRYVRFSHDIKEWYKEMEQAGLTFFEVEVLNKYLKDSFGISGSQEKLMLLVMDPQIAGYTLKEANDFRKAISKKITKKIQENKKKYFKKGAECGTRQVFLDYVWEKCVEPQLGYSFSLNHTLPYSVIAVQEMNLATCYNPLYWACACLCVNAGNTATCFEQEDEDEPEVAEVEEDNKIEEAVVAEKRVAPNYGKIAKAISDAQHHGVKIELPYINEAQVDFVPDIKNNAILYSLQAINVVNPDLMNRILTNRPFVSLRDFIDKVQPTNVQMLGLIKAGCFDKIVKKSRHTIMALYLQILADQNVIKKDKLTMTQVRQALDMGMALVGYEEEIRLFRFKKYIDKQQMSTDKKRYELSESECLKFFHHFLENELSAQKDDYSYVGEKIIIKISAFKRYFDVKMKTLLDYLNSPEGSEVFFKIQQESFIKEISDKYCQGTDASWEMETMRFYHTRHELSSMNEVMYNVKNFEALPEDPEPIGSFTKGDTIYYNYKLCALAGTVINSDNGKHIVSILTTHGAVNVKFYAELYNRYNAKISKLDPITKKKTVIDDSWFKRGNKIIVYGFRRENMFMVKTDKSSGYNRTVCLIDLVRDDGTLDMQFIRKKN